MRNIVRRLPAALFLLGAMGAPPTTTRAHAQGTVPGIVGWICTTDSSRWLQFSRCPASQPRGQAVDVRGFSAYTGEPIQGTATVDVPVPVQAQPLTADGVCAALGDPSLRIPHHGSSDIYERGLLKRKYCGY